ncbi:MAG: hypothetical protein A2566_03450 [Candidatus Zambryskibacteria bacterium RIFOXYD1_FULL_40_13]|nr:MAG: hypothetical protein UT25_C0002G0170 [Parcubacteria group bacterium GW2011_GWC1_39_12]KKR19330.1 MAG: hypothetical protein UT49_C0002G0176 [Parcubacteria group bacterium GW2011_GWF1_39_37]KKR35287.1 MAG: hypothetical protein UT68_C0004G0095 [Parcubacteria group bacterium GW2011_GWC2_40_10]KKR52281.1 MAG: hypothetical protein UT89_C0002G0082 [Parcubacteria group bacterium GW2011_GWE1_40_20]KKR66251.1 MAG: hypothetical protein UU06_C0003G0001 [Parcubacteria group bacterium GW2011_GWB1_40_
MPNQELAQLNKLVGIWNLEHCDLETKAKWSGKDVFEWLPGGHFLAYHHEEEKGIRGMMIIGHEMGWEETEPGSEIVGHWFESSSGYHYKYIWEVDDRTIQFWLNSKDSGMAFRGQFSEDGKIINGTWKWPGGGYDLLMRRVEP